MGSDKICFALYEKILPFILNLIAGKDLENGVYKM